jgi:RHH-type rel operon transcriptional repressor/antitoxin RelB
LTWVVTELSVAHDPWFARRLDQLPSLRVRRATVGGALAALRFAQCATTARTFGAEALEQPALKFGLVAIAKACRPLVHRRCLSARAGLYCDAEQPAPLAQSSKIKSMNALSDTLNTCIQTPRRVIMATSIRLDPILEQRLDYLAAKTGRTKSYYLRELVANGLDDLEDYYLAAATTERVRRGEEKIYSADQVRKDLGLDN